MHQPERHDGQIIIAGLLERADDQLARAFARGRVHRFPVDRNTAQHAGEHPQGVL